MLPVTKGVPRSGAQMDGETSLASGPTVVDAAGKWCRPLIRLLSRLLVPLPIPLLTVTTLTGRDVKEKENVSGSLPMAVAEAVVWITGQVEEAILLVTKGVPRSGAPMGGETSLASGPTVVDAAGK